MDRIYQGVEVTKDEQDVLFQMVGYNFQIHYERDNDQFVLAGYKSSIRAWPIEKWVFDKLVNKHLIERIPESASWFRLVRR